MPVSPTLAVSAPSSLPSLTVSPNPASAVVTVSGLPDGSRLALYDIYGRLVLNSELRTPNSALNVASLPDGIYILRAPGTPTATKLIIKH